MEKNKRYLFVIRTLKGGGAERVVSVLASKLADMGYDINILLYERFNDEYELSNRVKVFCMPEVDSNIWGKLQRVLDMRAIFKSIKPSVVLPFVGTIPIVAFFASLFLNISFIRTVRVSPWINNHGWLYGKLLEIVTKNSEAIMVQNEEQAEYFYPLHKDKVYIVPNMVSNRFLEIRKADYSNIVANIVTAGRLEKQKNHKLLIKAVSMLIPKYPFIKLLIYGEGKEYEKLREFIKFLNMEQSCFLMGRANNLQEVYAKADLFVMTSDFEGLPNSLIEAMAIGLPVISSDCKTGPRSIIDDGINGYLFKTGNLEDLVKKIEYCLNNSLHLIELGQNARKKVIENYTEKPVCEKLIYMFRNI